MSRLWTLTVRTGWSPAARISTRRIGYSIGLSSSLRQAGRHESAIAGLYALRTALELQPGRDAPAPSGPPRPQPLPRYGGAGLGRHESAGQVSGVEAKTCVLPSFDIVGSRRGRQLTPPRVCPDPTQAADCPMYARRLLAAQQAFRLSAAIRAEPSKPTLADLIRTEAVQRQGPRPALLPGPLPTRPLSILDQLKEESR